MADFVRTTPGSLYLVVAKGHNDLSDDEINEIIPNEEPAYNIVNTTADTQLTSVTGTYQILLHGKEFNNFNGGVYSLTIPNPDEDIAPDEASRRCLMEQFFGIADSKSEQGSQAQEVFDKANEVKESYDKHKISIIPVKNDRIKNDVTFPYSDEYKTTTIKTIGARKRSIATTLGFKGVLFILARRIPYIQIGAFALDYIDYTTCVRESLSQKEQRQNRLSNQAQEGVITLFNSRF